MPKSRKSSVANKRSAPATKDFKKLKAKVGKRAPIASNATKIDFTVRGIHMPNQGKLLSENKTEFVTRRKLDLDTLLGQANHYNASVRKESFLGMKEIYTSHPQLVLPSFSRVVQAAVTGMVDEDKGVRQALISLLTVMLPRSSQESGRPLMRLIIGYITSAMSHIRLDVRRDSVVFLDLTVSAYASLVWEHKYLIQLLPNVVQFFKDRVFGKGAGGGDVKGKKDTVFVQTLRCLQSLLSLSEHRRPGASSQSEEDPREVKASAQRSTLLKYATGLGDVIREGVDGRSEVEAHRQALAAFADQMVPMLVECWVETWAHPNSESKSETLLLIITCLLELLGILQGLKLPPAAGAGRQGRQGVAPFQERILSHIFQHFPVRAAQGRGGSSGPSFEATINTSVCQMMAFFMGTSGGAGCQAQEQTTWSQRVLSFIASAFNEADTEGTAGQGARKRKRAESTPRTEPYLLLPVVVPMLLPHLSATHQEDMLRSFSRYHGRLSSSPLHFKAKLACYGFILHLMEAAEGSFRLTPGLMRAWLDPLPRDLHCAAGALDRPPTAAVAEKLARLLGQLLGQVGRHGQDGFDALQPGLCSLFWCKKTEESAGEEPGPVTCCPSDIQMMAVRSLHHFTTISAPMLKAVLECSRHDAAPLQLRLLLVEQMQLLYTTKTTAALPLSSMLGYLLSITAASCSPPPDVLAAACRCLSALRGAGPTRATGGRVAQLHGWLLEAVAPTLLKTMTTMTTSGGADEDLAVKTNVFLRICHACCGPSSSESSSSESSSAASSSASSSASSILSSPSIMDVCVALASRTLEVLLTHCAQGSEEGGSAQVDAVLVLCADLPPLLSCLLTEGSSRAGDQRVPAVLLLLLREPMLRNELLQPAVSDLVLDAFQASLEVFGEASPCFSQLKSELKLLYGDDDDDEDEDEDEDDGGQKNMVTGEHA